MICPNCGKEIGEAKFCPECGTQIMINPATETVQPTIQPQVMIKKKKKKGKGCLISIIIFLILCFVLFVGLSKLSADLTPKQSEIAKVMLLTEEQEVEIKKVFDECGILDIKNVTLFQEGEKATSYHVNDVETASYAGINNTIVVWLYNENKAVKSIYFHDEDIYIDGEVIAKVSDFYVSKELRDRYRVTAQLMVKKTLNYPDTAKFESSSLSWAFGVQNGYDGCESTVQAQNAFGVPSTMKFQFRFDRNTGAIVYMSVGDTVYIDELN